MNVKATNLVLAVIVSALVAFGTSKYFNSRNSTGNEPARQQTTNERVFATGVIRCGYVTYPPGFIKDPNTGKVSGIFPEILEEAAKNLGLKVQWTEEVGWGTMIEGLKTNRYDLICSPVWPLAQRIRVADFSQPIFYGGAEAYVRADDSRFQANLSILNDSQYRIATTDGEVSDTIAQMDFPKAKRISMPQLTDISQLLLTVADGKADATFVEPHIAYQFLKNNPGKIQPSRPGNPLRLYPNTLMLKQNDEVFRRVLDNAITEIHNSGFVESVLLKHEPFPGAFYRNAKPIETGPSR